MCKTMLPNVEYCISAGVEMSIYLHCHTKVARLPCILCNARETFSREFSFPLVPGVLLRLIA